MAEEVMRPTFRDGATGNGLGGAGAESVTGWSIASKCDISGP